MKAKGHLIVFEGPDGVGKSTLANAVSHLLRELRLEVCSASLPGIIPGTLRKHVYELHHSPERFGVKYISPTCLQMLHAAAHIEALEETIRPALRQGQWVVLDRFWWSTIAYGQTFQADQDTLGFLEQLATKQWNDILPTALFLVYRDSVLHSDLHFALTAEYECLATRQKGVHPIYPLHNETNVIESAHKVISLISSYLPSRSVKRKKDSQTSNRGSISLEGPVIWKQHDPVKPTPVFDSYWRFAAERQEILFRRLSRQKPPWTDDAIMRIYRFTNAYRAADRVSQYLIRHVIYDGTWNREDLFFRILLFKIFNRIETWECLERAFGPLHASGFDLRRFSSVLAAVRAKGHPIYSAAYIMASGSSAFGHHAKHDNHLAMLKQMLDERVAMKLSEAKSLSGVYDLLRGYPTIGTFLAFQYSIDLNYSELTDFSEMSYVVPGPGALDGISKCFADRGGLTETEIIKWTAERQDVEFERLGIAFRDLFGRKLQLIDCQNLFCEISKYARVRHPEFGGRSGRTKIKQHFAARPESVSLWFPPKWKINHLIAVAGLEEEDQFDADLFGDFSKFDMERGRC